VSPTMDFDLKERVRMSSDIVDVIGRHLELRPQGRDLVARCPWHDDRSPSLHVSPQRQTWRCWVCNIGGDVFSYVMRRDGVEFVEALKTLAEQAGIEYQPTGRKVAPGSPEDKSALLAAMKFAEKAFFEFLENDDSVQTQAARDYLAQRGIDDSSRQLFRIGYAPDFTPDRWTWLLDEARRAGHSGEVLRAAGLAVARDGGKGHYDMFRGRLMFPIWDPQDRPISMGGRVLPGADPREANRKYINGPETLLFSKSRQLYGLNLARVAMQKSREVLVMEGYTDVIAARQAGIESVVAVLGTALGTQHIDLLKRFVDRVVLVLDGDAAGRRRADQVLELFVVADVDLRIVTLPGGADPADFVNQFGREALEALVHNAPDALEHKLSTLTDGVDLTRDTHRATKAIEDMLDLLARAGEPGDLRTSQMLVRLAKTFSIPTDELRRQLDSRARAARQRPQGFYNQAPEPTVVVPTRSEPLAPIQGIDRELFEIMIEHPLQAAQVIEQIDPMWLHSSGARTLMQVYQDLELEGRDLDLNSVLMMIEDENLKGLVVGIDEAMRQRTGLPPQSFQERFQAVLARLHVKQSALSVTHDLNRIEREEQESDDSDAATRMLGDLINSLRPKHGIRPR
jgi:DNA primase